MKYEFMRNHENEFSVEKMSIAFKVSRSGYYRFINAKPSKRSLEDERLLRKIKVIHEMSRKTYGSPRIHAELSSRGNLFTPSNSGINEKSWHRSKDEKTF